MTDSLSGACKVDLALEADFILGGLKVCPSLCVLVANGEEERVEPRVMEVLVTLAKAADRTVTRNQLIDACWDGRVVSDDAITRAVTKVRQLGRAHDPPHFTVEAVPRVGFRLVVPPSTAPEAAETGLAAAPTRTENLLIRLKKRIGWTGIVGAVLAIGLITIGVSWPPDWKDPAFAEDHVIVLPFEALSADVELTRLSRRASEAVARRLTMGGVPTELSGAPSLPGAATPPAAEFIVTGSVDIEASETVIKGAITSRESRIVLWSSVAARPTAEILGFDEDFGGRVARVLRCALHERTAAKIPFGRNVFSLFLRACEAVFNESTQGIDLTRRLVSLVPDVGGAYALHAFALATHAAKLDYLSDEAASLTSAMRIAAERALALDPSAVYAHAALGARIGTEAHYLERENHLLQALAIDPDHVAVRGEYSLFLREVGRIGAAREALMRIDGTSAMLLNSAFLYAMTGDLPTAREHIDHLDAVNPYLAHEARWVVGIWWEAPMNGLAKLPVLAKAVGRTDQLECFMVHLTALVRASSRPLVRGLPAACAHFDSDWKVRMLARQGDIEGAYAAMKEPLPRSRQGHMFLFYPEMKAFRHDTRFMPLAARLGLVSYWRATNQWPDFCADPDLPYKCK